MKWNLTPIIRRIRQMSIRWKTVKLIGDNIFQAGWRLGVLLLLLGVSVFLIRGLQNDTYAIEAFQVPEVFDQSGFTGVVMAKKLVDELSEVENFISSVKEGPLNNIQSNVGEPDLNVEVMGIGLTLNTVTYYLRDLLGRENRSISGEITDIDHSLALTLRITGVEPFYAFYSYEEGGRTEGIKALLHEAAKRIILHLDPYRMAVYHYKKNDEKRSLEVIGDMLDNRPEDAGWAYMAWGNLLNQAGKPKEAIEKFQIAAERDPELYLNLSNWAWTEFRLRNYESAAPKFEKLTKALPKRGEYWNALALCHAGLKNYKEANKAYLKAVEAEPYQLNWYGNWAQFRQEQKDTAGIEEIFLLMKKNLDFTGPDYHLALAQYSFFTGKNDEALASLEKALAMDPFNVEALRYYIPLCFEEKKDYPKVKSLAYRLIERVEEQRQTPPRYMRQTLYNYIAMAEYKMGQLDSALIHTQLAIEQDSMIAYPYSTLAETYDLMGDKEAFYQAIEIALKKGFNLGNYLDTEPYVRYSKEERFQALLEKYKP